jgi:integrase
VADIDSQRMVLRIEQGKGGRDREIPLSPTLLTALREYYRWMRPQTYLFPGTRHGWRADTPITTKVIWEAVRLAARKAGIDKRVTPHTLRHYAECRIMPSDLWCKLHSGPKIVTAIAGAARDHSA